MPGIESFTLAQLAHVSTTDAMACAVAVLDPKPEQGWNLEDQVQRNAENANPSGMQIELHPIASCFSMILSDSQRTFKVGRLGLESHTLSLEAPLEKLLKHMHHML